ncbi:MAG: Fur family transcriptional regulator [Planctomycetota bacterium]
MSNRLTSQRTAIVEALRNAPGPLRPCEILDLASARAPTLGIATVYRQLKRMLEAGNVCTVELGRQDVRYELTDRGHPAHHPHFVCRNCGDAFDVPRSPDGIADLAPPGFALEDHELTLYGRCSDCIKANDPDAG